MDRQGPQRSPAAPTGSAARRTQASRGARRKAAPPAFPDPRRFPWTRFKVSPDFSGCVCNSCGLSFVAVGPDAIWNMRVRVVLHLRAVHGLRPIVP